MRTKNLAVLLATAAVIGTIALAPADAAQRNAPGVSRSKPGVVASGRAPTRLTVRKRSFLDPGTETLPFNQHYHDYAVGPTYGVFPSYFRYGTAPGSFERMPLPGLWDIPGWTRF